MTFNEEIKWSVYKCAFLTMAIVSFSCLMNKIKNTNCDQFFFIIICYLPAVIDSCSQNQPIKPVDMSINVSKSVFTSGLFEARK